MKRPRKSTGKSRRMKVIRLWNYPEAARAVPYLRSVLESLRVNYIDALRHRQDVQKLSDKRPDRATLIALDDARKELEHSEDAFKDNHRELRKLDVFLLDPLNGIALVPTQKDEELAWMVFDTYDNAGIVGWRWHKDPFETRRGVEELKSTPPTAKA